jgi:hypothetical protein
LQHLLQMLIAFSIEINIGKILSKNIAQSIEPPLAKRIQYQESEATVTTDDQELTSSKEFINKYPFINIYDKFPSSLWWQNFFDKGILDAKELEQNLLTSRYFINRDIPDWARLWGFKDLSDKDFNTVIKQVESKWRTFDYDKVEVVMHIHGIFLLLSKHELYSLNEGEILNHSKLYIDHLRSNNKLPLSNTENFTGYRGLGFQGEDSDEFKELRTYINEVQKSVKIENLPIEGEELLNIMQNNVSDFCDMIRMNGRTVVIHNSNRKYFDTPIFNYIEPNVFLEKLSCMKHEDKEYVFKALLERYQPNNESLIEEKEWLKSIKDSLEKEAKDKLGKVSGFNAKRYITSYVDKAIQSIQTPRA